MNKYGFIRTLVFLIEANCKEDEQLYKKTVKTLREYADALEKSQGGFNRCATPVGDYDIEKWEDSQGCIVKVVHGIDFPI